MIVNTLSTMTPNQTKFAFYVFNIINILLWFAFFDRIFDCWTSHPRENPVGLIPKPACPRTNTFTNDLEPELSSVMIVILINISSYFSGYLASSYDNQKKKLQ